MSSTDGDIPSSASHLFGVDALAYIADCSDADVFRVSGIGGGELEHASALSKRYDQQARVYAFQQVKYYLADSSHATLPDDSEAPALFRSINNGEGQELVQGVQDMHILYGMDDDGDGAADRYVNAEEVGNPGVANWANVVSVRVALLMESLTAGSDKVYSRDYSLLDKTVSGFDDRQLRRVATFTIALRNRTH
jgi:type IV pilus assembly protein PilW